MKNTLKNSEKLRELNQIQEQKHTDLFNKCGLFFAFSNEQFTENKTPLKEGEKYVSIGAGGYLPKGNVKMFKDGMKDIKKWYKDEIKAGKAELRKAKIVYELSNYESYYTGDITDALQALGNDYTEAEVMAIYNEQRELVDY